MSDQPNRVYEFGEFRLDTTERLLLRGEEQIPLRPKAFNTLLLLLEKSGRLVEKEELMSRVWAGAFVEEANLARNIWTLRKALGDGDGKHQYIETVPKVGYRFVAEVRKAPNRALEVVVQRHIRARIITSVYLFIFRPRCEKRLRLECRLELPAAVRLFLLFGDDARDGVTFYHHVGASVPNLSHGGDEAIADLRDRLDVLGCVGRLAQHPPQRRDVPIEVALFDELARPDPFQQLVFREHVPVVIHERHEDGEILRPQRDGLAVTKQDVLCRV
ncbi:MAG: transcriptional regulator [Acidobacteriota bacterium]|nr:transcriptional regulator [Acidobacteriota bacterium]